MVANWHNSSELYPYSQSMISTSQIEVFADTNKSTHIKVVHVIVHITSAISSPTNCQLQVHNYLKPAHHQNREHTITAIVVTTTDSQQYMFSPNTMLHSKTLPLWPVGSSPGMSTHWYTCLKLKYMSRWLFAWMKHKMADWCSAMARTKCCWGYYSGTDPQTDLKLKVISLLLLFQHRAATILSKIDTSTYVLSQVS